MKIPALASYYYGGGCHTFYRGYRYSGAFLCTVHTYQHRIDVSTCTVVTSPCLSGWCHKRLVRVRVMSQIFELGRDENEINNTGFGVNRYRCVHQY